MKKKIVIYTKGEVTDIIYSYKKSWREQYEKSIDFNFDDTTLLFGVCYGQSGKNS
jgi:hypothetical protein